MIPHIMAHCKPISEDEKAQILTEDHYIPMRNRCNVLVDYPQLLSNVDNPGYTSHVGIPLTMGNTETNLEARKQPAFVQDLRQFVGDFISLLTSRKNKKLTPQVGTQIHAYSDKGTLPLLLTNMNASTGVTVNRKPQLFWELLRDTKAILLMDWKH